MTAVGLALPLADEERLVAEAARHGHRVVLRCSGADELASRVAATPPELVLVAAEPQYLTARLVEVCDRAGVRMVVVASEGRERWARSLGVVDAITGPARWELLEDPNRVPPPREDPTPATGSRGSAADRRAVEPARRRESRWRWSPRRRPDGDRPDAGASAGAGAGAAVVSAGDAASARGFASITRAAAATDPASRAGFSSAAGFAEEPDSVALSAPTPRQAVVIAVWGPHGAPGRTAIAIAVAAELSASGARVALADADTHAAAIAPSLGLLDEAPGFAVACRLAGAGSLDGEEFERLARTHDAPGSRIHVLTGLTRAARWPEISGDRVRAVIAAARDWVDYLVIDVAASLEHDEELTSDVLAPRRNAATDAVLGAADHVIEVGRADPVGLARFLHAHAELLEVAAPPRTSVVLNRLRASAIGLDAAGQVRQTLQRFGGIEHPVLVPDDPAAFDAAVLSGTTLAGAAPRSAALAAIREFVQSELLPPSAATPRRVRRRREERASRAARGGGRSVRAQRLA
ncbi:AAA family ATPase [Schumannella soli]|uniref:ParA family protein n=1 Tax=Schumannella soli TaxID=2590779 RepID=A0A506Y9R3_9MICO|nr:ParA family protein [Schumannella soli]TPW77199.1 ParA family protein [Schumannella soli]